MHNVEQPTGSPARVLVVDDDRAVSMALERSLRQLGYEVLVAADGTEGFEQALRAEPAVVLADVHMPGMDGHALLRRLMRSGLHSSVILMSGQGELDDAIGAFREGAIDYLKKPWTQHDLSAALQRAMGLAGALRELTVTPRTPQADGRGGSGPGAAAPPLDAAAFVQGLAGEAKTQPIFDPLTTPPLHTALRSLRLGRSPGGRVDQDVGALFAVSPRLTSAILRAVGGLDDTSTIDDAIRGLASRDFDALHESIEALALRELFPIRVAALRTLNERIWRFSLARALAMRGIADLRDPQSPHDRHAYFLVGLWLDVGASFLLAEIATEMQRRDSGIADSSRMTAAVATQHAKVGAALLRSWEAPADWIAMTGAHHAGPPAEVAHMHCAVLIAGALAVRVCGFSDPSGDRDLRSDSMARCAYTLGLGDSGLRRLTKALTEDADTIWAACS